MIACTIGRGSGYVARANRMDFATAEHMRSKLSKPNDS